LGKQKYRHGRIVTRCSLQNAAQGYPTSQGGPLALHKTFAAENC